jgi:hypothetical protein
MGKYDLITRLFYAHKERARNVKEVVPGSVPSEHETG